MKTDGKSNTASIATLEQKAFTDANQSTKTSERMRIKWSMRFMALLLPLIAGACALPVPIQIAIWAGDGISYLTTSKSLSDHGLSTITGQDCAIHRGLTEGSICRGIEDSLTVLASREGTLENAANTAPSFIDDWGLPESHGLSANSEIQHASSEFISDIADTAIYEASNSNGYYYVLGAFSVRENAGQLMALSADLSPVLEKTDDDYRVVVGPVAPRDMMETYEKISAAGFYEVWTYARNYDGEDNQFAVISYPEEDLS